MCFHSCCLFCLLVGVCCFALPAARPSSWIPASYQGYMLQGWDQRRIKQNKGVFGPRAVVCLSLNSIQMSVFLRWRRAVLQFALQRKTVYEANSKEKFIRLFVLWYSGRRPFGRDHLQIRSLKFQNEAGTSDARRKKQCVLPFNPVSLRSEREK